MRKAVLGLFVALAAVLTVAVAPFASADQIQTVACCGGMPGHP